jgi:hypothetical protein
MEAMRPFIPSGHYLRGIQPMQPLQSVNSVTRAPNYTKAHKTPLEGEKTVLE